MRERVIELWRMLCLFLLWQEIFFWGNFFSFFLPLALSFWYWCLSCVHGLQCIIPLTLLSLGSLSQKELEVTQGEIDLRFKLLQNTSKGEEGGKEASASEHPVQPLGVVFHPYLGKSWARIFQLDSCLHSNMSVCSLMYSVSPARITSTHLLNE